MESSTEVYQIVGIEKIKYTKIHKENMQLTNNSDTNMQKVLYKKIEYSNMLHYTH